MRPSIALLFVLAVFLGQARSQGSSSTSCQAAGGDSEDDSGLAITCNTDTSGSGKPIPLPNLAKEVNGLTVFSVNASDDVSIDTKNVESVTYTGNSDQIPDGAFSAFSNLRELIIDFSQASVGADGSEIVPQPVGLKPNAFKGLENTLKRLELIGINLAGAGGFPAAIQQLKALEHLKLEDCLLKGQLKGQDVQNLKNLKSLSISGSPDFSVADDVFSNYANTMERVVLNRVQVKSIPKSVSSLKVLTVFHAIGGGLTALPAVFQASGSTLKELRLSDNSITSIDAGAFKGLSALTTLVLSQNQISSLPNGLFADLVSLENLQLNGNKLTTASTQNAFSSLKTLKLLSMNENQLDSITPGTLAGIESSATILSFSGNQIKSVKGTSKLTQAPQLVLSSNGIDALNPGTIESGSTFTELLLDSNPITGIKAGSFNNIDAGTNFAVDDTALGEFDLSSLSGMKNIQNLTIANNADLRTIKVSSDSAVPSTLKYIILDNNGRLVLTDSDGKLASYLQKSGVRLIFLNQVYCHCQLGWLTSKWPKGAGDRKSVISFVTPSQEEDVDPTPTTCCNYPDTTVDDFLANKLAAECAGDKASAPFTDEDTC